MDSSRLLDADGLVELPEEHHEHALLPTASLSSSSSTADASASSPLVEPYSSSFTPSQPWSYYFTLSSLTRRKTTAIVMAEASEDSGNPTPPSHSSTSRPPSPLSSSAPPSILPPSTPLPKVGLRKVLTVYDVIAYGVSSTIGAGIFVSTGAGALAAGPAVMVSFLLAALSCLFSAFAYCEFASRVPVSGSAYTFTYVTLGELAAWFIGWNLTLEYCISAAAVARAWASNLLLFFAQVGLPLPEWLAAIQLVKDGDFFQSLSPLSALICLACTVVLLLGVKESSRVNLVVTCMNISIILFIIIAGSTYISTANYTAAPPDPNLPAALQCNRTQPDTPTSSSSSYALHFNSTADSLLSSLSLHTPSSLSSPSPLGALPFPPPAKGSYFARGLNGVLTGGGLVFFAFVGFDSVTTLAEEVQNPKRDLPIGIMTTLAISTALYAGASAVLTGMLPWYCVDNSAPLARAFSFVGNDWATTLIAVCTVTGLSTTTLASLFGQPRIFYRMSKDGLLFYLFQSVHPRTQVPYWGTIITGAVAATIAFFLSIDSLQNMISIGTLMAFSTVCAGIVILRYQPQQGESLTRSWRNNATVFVAVFVVLSIALSVALTNIERDLSVAVPIVLGLLTLLPVIRLALLPVNAANTSADLFLCPLVPWLPCCGIFTNVYLICSLDWESYVRILVWTVLGFLIYFLYGIRYSRLGRRGDINKAQEQGTLNAHHRAQD